jgi:predicted anti-sigma-YlaC factor YlaD
MLLDTKLHDTACERARRLASLRPDDVGTELEEAFLTSHLADCVACRAYAEGVSATTAAIRAAAPIEGPRLTISRPARRRVPMRALQTAAAAVIVAAAGLSGLSGLDSLSQQQRDDPAPSTQRLAYLDSASYEQRLIADLTRAPVRLQRGSRIAT